MSDFDIDYIKKQFCNYKCPYKNDTVSIIECSSIRDICPKCEEDITFYDDIEVQVDLCEHCQINNFIRELKEYKALS